jgi:hypothetical protein
MVFFFSGCAASGGSALGFGYLNSYLRNENPGNGYNMIQLKTIVASGEFRTCSALAVPENASWLTTMRGSTNVWKLLKRMW